MATVKTSNGHELDPDQVANITRRGDGTAVVNMKDGLGTTVTDEDADKLEKAGKAKPGK